MEDERTQDTKLTPEQVRREKLHRFAGDFISHVNANDYEIGIAIFELFADMNILYEAIKQAQNGLACIPVPTEETVRLYNELTLALAALEGGVE